MYESHNFVLLFEPKLGDATYTRGLGDDAATVTEVLVGNTYYLECSCLARECACVCLETMKMRKETILKVFRRHLVFRCYYGG